MSAMHADYALVDIAIGLLVAGEDGGEEALAEPVAPRNGASWCQLCCGGWAGLVRV